VPEIHTIRGEKMARLVAYKDTKDEIFGLWKNRDNRESVDEYVRSIRERKGA
jgi:hypothetical protein